MTSSISSPQPRPERFFTYSELFAGVGGFGVALRRLGGHPIFVSEWESQERLTYLKNFPEDESILAGDIRMVSETDIPHHDILSGGFPCQPFSRLGDQSGVDDDKKGRRGTLFAEIVRILRVSQPRAFILENVPGLVSTNNGRDLRRIVQELEGVGYASVRCAILDSALILPQKRRRLFFVGFRSRAAADAFEWPTLPNLGRSVKDILQQDDDNCNLEAFRLKSNQWQRSLSINPDGSSWMIDIAGVAPTLTRKYKRTPGKRSGTRIARDGATNNGNSNKIGGHNLVPYPAQGPSEAPPARFFTARECARLQGFPETYQIPRENEADGPGAALFGNAVSPPITAALASKVLDALDRKIDNDISESSEAYLGDSALTVAFDMALDAVQDNAKPALMNKIEDVYRSEKRIESIKEISMEKLSVGLICFDYRDTGYCSRGHNCRFLHESTNYTAIGPPA